MNDKDILDRARGFKDGNVIPEEVEYAREILRNKKGDIIFALNIVGLCGNDDDALLIEDYTKNDLRNIYGEKAFTLICREMGLFYLYRSLIRAFISGDEIRFEGDRMSALNVADLYFKDFEDKKLGLIILDIMMDYNNKDRVSARFALIRVLELEEFLNDPLRSKFANDDRDSRIIIDAAKKKFGFVRS